MTLEELTLEQLKSENTRLHNLIKENVKAQQAITRIPFVERWKAEEGDTVDYSFDGTRRIGVVKEIRFNHINQPVTYVVWQVTEKGKVTGREAVVWMHSEDPIKVISKAPRG